jgi:hypothetical protein
MHAAFEASNSRTEFNPGRKEKLRGEMHGAQKVRNAGMQPHASEKIGNRADFLASLSLNCADLPSLRQT